MMSSYISKVQIKVDFSVHDPINCKKQQISSICSQLMLLWSQLWFYNYSHQIWWTEALLLQCFSAVNEEESRKNTNLFTPQDLYVSCCVILDNSCPHSPLQTFMYLTQISVVTNIFSTSTGELLLLESVASLQVWKKGWKHKIWQNQNMLEKHIFVRLDISSICTSFLYIYM